MKELDGEVLAISVDHIYSHRVFDASLSGLPFPLLADWHRTVTKSYGVYNEEQARANRSAFVLDREGVVRFVNPQFDARNQQHYDQVLQALKEIP